MVADGKARSFSFSAQQPQLRRARRPHHVCSRSPQLATKARSLSGNCIARPWTSNSLLMCLAAAVMRCSNSSGVSCHGVRQWAACSQHLRFYRRSRTEPERSRWKLQGKRSTHDTDPGRAARSSGRHARRSGQRAHNTCVCKGGAGRSRSGTGGSSKENAQLMKRNRTEPAAEPAHFHGSFRRNAHFRLPGSPLFKIKKKGLPGRSASAF